MDDTLDILSDEDKTEITTRTRIRHICEICGESAHYKYTFLLKGGRANPQSSAYGKDDCSWCYDAALFSCRDQNCRNELKYMDGHEACSVFPASERFAHMFLYWENWRTNLEK